MARIAGVNIPENKHLRRVELQTPEAGLGQVRPVHQSLRASIRQQPDRPWLIRPR